MITETFYLGIVQTIARHVPEMDEGAAHLFLTVATAVFSKSRLAVWRRESVFADAPEPIRDALHDWRPPVRIDRRGATRIVDPNTASLREPLATFLDYAIERSAAVKSLRVPAAAQGRVLATTEFASRLFAEPGSLTYRIEHERRAQRSLDVLRHGPLIAGRGGVDEADQLTAIRFALRDVPPTVLSLWAALAVSKTDRSAAAIADDIFMNRDVARAGARRLIAAGLLRDVPDGRAMTLTLTAAGSDVAARMRLPAGLFTRTAAEYRPALTDADLVI